MSEYKSLLDDVVDRAWPPGASQREGLTVKRNLVREVLGELRSKQSTATATGARQIRSVLDTGTEYLGALDERIAELAEQEKREERANAHHVLAGTAERESRGYENQTRVSGEQVYTPERGQSFFQDLIHCRRGDWAAADRLHRNNQVQYESRALGNTGAVGGSGGEFAAPAWLVDQFVELARPGRVAADLTTKATLPGGVSSINLPAVATGTTEAVQTTQNTAVSQTDLTTAAVSSNIVTIAGKQVISQQLIDQSGVAFDQVIFSDLTRACAQQLDLQVLSGTGTGGQLAGLLNVTGANAITFTAATPAVTGAGGFLNAITRAINAVQVTRYLAPTAILMHPRRWNWVLEATDTSNRPLVTPNGPQYNGVGVLGNVNGQGEAGTLQGLPVFLDPNVPTNLGAGTNQDPVVVARFEDLFLWETAPVAASFDQPYSDSLSVLLRLHQYAAFIPKRYPSALAIINGTGMVAPVL